MKFQTFKAILFFLLPILTFAQTIPTPNILEVKNDDRAATIYWNSKTATYHSTYNPDYQNGVYNYLIEWGNVNEGFTDSEVTPFRIFMIQPLEPGEVYQARVYNLDAYGNKSAPSAIVQFQHSTTKVDAMRNRLNGFFDDFNLPMGAFDEKNWNQSYSGCMTIGKTSQHINSQFHAHNVIASGRCDRGVASSRLRQTFDFTDRTGTIEFDLDGSKLSRQFWYLDLTPATRKRDLTGHTALEVGGPPQSDPAYLLRFVERGGNVLIQLADENGLLHTLDNMYENDACGDLMEFCNGENLLPVPNVRRHWKIELSKTHVKVFINDILVVDGSLITDFAPSGLPYEVAQINWLIFSYNTGKENIPLVMMHWDNFGIDAPDGFSPSTVIHNYTDGILGTETTSPGNEPSLGKTSTTTTSANFEIPIPDPIMDNANSWPLKTELMFTVQGGDYEWTSNDYILVNGQNYAFPEPISDIIAFPTESLINSTKPHSAILEIDPAHLVQGDNQIQFFLNQPRLLNVHIELTYPIADAPNYTPPKDIFFNHTQTLMTFKDYNQIGPGIVLSKMDGFHLWQSEFEKVGDGTGQTAEYVKQSPVSGIIELDVTANSNAQLAATGHAEGIAYYEIWLDQQVIQTFRVDNETPVAYFQHKNIELDTRLFTNGEHELFFQAYDVDGRPSMFDAFEAHAEMGEYIPVVFTIQNEALALNLDDFNAKKEADKVQLSWKSNMEKEGLSFEIQRSENGNNWLAIGEIEAKKDNTETYVFYDKNPILGENYYRIKSTFETSEVAFSSIKKVLFEDKVKVFNLFPNPSDGLVYLESNGFEWSGVEIELFDFIGRKIKNLRVEKQGSYILEIGLEGISEGIYWIEIKTENRVWVEKLIVK